jgi:hypothetical protein
LDAGNNRLAPQHGLGRTSRHSLRLPGPTKSIRLTGRFYADDLTRFRASDGQLRSGLAWDLVGIYSGRTSDSSDIGIVWKRSAIEAIVEHDQRPDEQHPYVCPLDEDVHLQSHAEIVVPLGENLSDTQNQED